MFCIVAVRKLEIYKVQGVFQKDPPFKDLSRHLIVASFNTAHCRIVTRKNRLNKGS